MPWYKERSTKQRTFGTNGRAIEAIEVKEADYYQNAIEFLLDAGVPLEHISLANSGYLAFETERMSDSVVEGEWIVKLGNSARSIQVLAGSTFRRYFKEVGSDEPQSSEPESSPGGYVKGASWQDN